MVIKLLCIRVVLSWDKIKVWQNLLDSDNDHYVRQLATLALCFSSHVTKPDLSELLDGAYLH